MGATELASQTSRRCWLRGRLLNLSVLDSKLCGMPDTLTPAGTHLLVIYVALRLVVRVCVGQREEHPLRHLMPASGLLWFLCEALGPDLGPER